MPNDVPSLKLCCLDVLSEGMRHAEHHEMRSTFMRHLLSNAEKAGMAHMFINDLIAAAQFDPRCESKTVAERIAALQFIEDCLRKHTPEDLLRLKVRAPKLSSKPSADEHSAPTLTRMEKMRQFGTVTLDPATIFDSIADFAIKTTRQRKATSDRYGNRIKELEPVHAQFRAAARELLLQMSMDPDAREVENARAVAELPAAGSGSAGDSSWRELSLRLLPSSSLAKTFGTRVADGAHEAALLGALGRRTMNKGAHRDPEERVRGVDLLERVNLPAAAATIARVIDKETAREPVAEAVRALQRLHPHDLSDAELKRLVSTLNKAARSISARTHQRYYYGNAYEDSDDFGEDGYSDDDGFWPDEEYVATVCYSKSGWMLASAPDRDLLHMKFGGELRRRERLATEAKRTRAAEREQKKAAAAQLVENALRPV